MDAQLNSPILKPTVPSPMVLLVDDNPDDREHYIRALKRMEHMDYRYLEAAGGESMFDALNRMRPDCMLLDYSLPGRNGLDLLRQVVAEHPHLPVIMMTGQGNETIAAQSIKDGAQHYLVKSDMTPELLHEAITAAIRQRAVEYERGLLVQKLTTANTELERFAYVASHDLKEPIRMVVSFSQLLMEEHAHQLDDTGLEYLSLIRESSARMRDMVEDLLAYSRLTNGDKNHKLFNGQIAVSAAADNLQELIRESGAKLDIAPIPELYGNPVQFIRLLQNLITNAIKYQPEGRTPEIAISCADEGDYWHISVADNGMGIEPEFIDQIFLPFRRLHVWEKIQGTGLGLTVCRTIVEDHGGRIWVTSKPDQGSVFHFTLAKP